MLNSIPNPTKSFSVNFSHSNVKQAMSNLSTYLGMAEAPGYQVDHFDEMIGELRLRKTEFLSLGVVIVIHANMVNETTTNISIEVQRAIGTFDKRHEVTYANEHMNLVTQALSSLLQNPSMDVNHNSFLLIKNRNADSKVFWSALGWVFFAPIKFPIWLIKNKKMEPKRKLIWASVYVLLMLFGYYQLNKSFDEQTFETAKASTIHKKLEYYADSVEVTLNLYNFADSRGEDYLDIVYDLDEMTKEQCAKMCDSVIVEFNTETLKDDTTTYMCAAEKEILLSYYDLTEKDVNDYLNNKRISPYQMDILSNPADIDVSHLTKEECQKLCDMKNLTLEQKVKIMNRFGEDGKYKN